ncbi:hypothetical protein ACF0H5_022685 [Mactra antiquata]
MELGLTIEPGSVRSLAPGASNSSTSTQASGGSKASLINQIAAQLANSKASNSSSTNIAIAPAPISNGKEKSKNSIVANMTEAISLKQSPTLTKQLSKPSRDNGSGVQVITQYMCRYCGQQFESTDDMQRHIQEHVTGKAPHECSVCGKTYRTPSKLQRHVRVHSGERPYACSICGRRFTRSDHVKQHMKVHCQPKDANVCHLCNDMKFSRRQALHLHLQQQHVLQQVFTCHRCGEAYESLEEMQTHKLTHDTVLNSMKDGGSLPSSTSGTAVAKFALGQQKNEQGMNKYDTIKPDSSEDSKQGVVLKVPNNNGFYIPANLDNVSALSNKLIMEGMEKMAAEMEVQKKYQEELNQLNVEARKYMENLHAEEKKLEDERMKIAECFTIKASSASNTPSKLVIDESQAPSDSSIDIVAGKETTTVVNGDGMSMFILPTTLQKNSGDNENNEETEMDADDTESEQNSSKDSVAINREGDGEKSEGDDKMDTSGESSKLDDSVGDKSIDEAANEEKISKTKPDGYSKPCPKSKKPGYVTPPSQSSDAKTVMTDEYVGIAPKPLLSILNPKINELIKAKVEQNMSHPNQTTYLVAPPTINMSQQQMPKLTFIPSIAGNKYPSLPTILPAPGVSSNAYTSTPPPLTQPMSIKSKTDSPKLIKCDHCCIYFEDNAMSMLHNTLHSADSMDPFTCRKCYKKLGNRLEFMAHMVWHLEPNMDI